jgi:hypothetical protein
MARSRLCRVCDGFHDLNTAWPAECAAHFGAVSAGAPYVISDSMDAVRSMADGQMYDSKSRYRAELRARGCYELGNDRVEPRSATPPPVRDTLRRTFQQLSSR